MLLIAGSYLKKNKKWFMYFWNVYFISFESKFVHFNLKKKMYFMVQKKTTIYNT